MKPTLIVAGLGRCGSSLCMQMLNAGGIECLGEYPAFEPEESDAITLTTSRLYSHAGKAVKCLDPQRADQCSFEEVQRMVIWLDRDTREQAKSIAKFGRLVGGIQFTRSQLGPLREGLHRDRLFAFSALRLSRCPALRIEFEHIIQAPMECSARIAAFLAPHWRIDVAAAARAVVDRPSTCLPYLLEAALIEARRCGKSVQEVLANG